MAHWWLKALPSALALALPSSPTVSFNAGRSCVGSNAATTP